MIEAVNSVLSNASLTKGAAEQQSAVKSYASNPERVQEVAQAPYVSPYISVDSSSNRAVLQIRDSDTGDVVRQFPTEGQLKAYRTAQSFVDKAESSNSRVVVDTEAPRTELEAPTTVDTSAAPASSSVTTEA